MRQMGEEVNGRVKEADQEALKLKLYDELGGAAKLPADLELCRRRAASSHRRTSASHALTCARRAVAAATASPLF